MTKATDENWYALANQVRCVDGGCVFHAGGEPGPREDRAFLAAAAPDLYRALDALRTVDNGQRGSAGYVMALQDALGQADAALRKARGENQ